MDSFWGLLSRNVTRKWASGRNLAFGYDREVSSGKNLILGQNKEVGFMQDYDFELGQGSWLKYLCHSNKLLETMIMGVTLFIALFVP